MTDEKKQALMNGLLASQQARADDSRARMKEINSREDVVLPPVEEGAVRVNRIVNPEDLRPSGYTANAEDVVASSEDEGGRFEKREDYTLVKIDDEEKK